MCVCVWGGGGIRELDKGIGPWATLEDAKEPETTKY